MKRIKQLFLNIITITMVFVMFTQSFILTNAAPLSGSRYTIGYNTSYPNQDYLGVPSVTIAAMWSANPYTVIYQKGLTNIAAASSPTTDCIYDQNVALISSPPFTGRSYCVSFDSQGGSAISDITGNLTFSGKWLINSTEYTAGVSHVKPNFTTSGNIDAQAIWDDYTIDLSLYIPTMDGRVFIGWYEEPEGINQITSINIEPNTTAFNKTIYARWKTKIEHANFATEGTVDATAVWDSSDILLDDVPTKVGYVFDGWGEKVINGDDTEYPIRSYLTVNPDTVPYSNTVYAQWSPVKYNITYDYNGGTSSLGGSYPSEVMFNNIAEITPPSRTGFTFLGWQTDSSQLANDCPILTLKKVDAWNGVETAPSFIDIASYLYVKNTSQGGLQSPHNYTGSYMINSTDSTSYTYSTQEFSDYWTLSGGVYSLDNPCSIIFNPKANGFKNLRSTPGTVLLSAQWSPKVVDFIFNINKPSEMTDSLSGQSFANKSTTYATTFNNTVGFPNANGWAFLGWFADDGNSEPIYKPDGSFNENRIDYWDSLGNLIYTGKGSINETINLYAHWEPKSFSVIWKLNKPLNMTSATNPDSISSETFKFDYHYEAVVPSADGWEFNGWYDAKTGGNQVFDENGMPKSPLYWTFDNGVGKWSKDIS